MPNFLPNFLPVSTPVEQLHRQSFGFNPFMPIEVSSPFFDEEHDHFGYDDEDEIDEYREDLDALEC